MRWPSCGLYGGASAQTSLGSQARLLTPHQNLEHDIVSPEKPSAQEHMATLSPVARGLASRNLSTTSWYRCLFCVPLWIIF